MVEINSLVTKIKIGDSEIIDSGVLLLDENEVITYNITSHETNLNFKFRFITDVEKKNADGTLMQDFDYNISSDSEGQFLDFKFINMSEARSSGNVRKVNLAHISGHPISFKFRILAIGKNPVNYQLSYTWYLEPKQIDETGELKEDKSL